MHLRSSCGAISEPNRIDCVPRNSRNSTLYCCTDANQSVAALVDASGTVVERYLYDPYGKATVCDGSWTPREGNASAYSNEVLFTGHRLDPESGRS
jgi:hypothetical protein